MSLRGSIEGKTVSGKINRLVELRGYSAYEIALGNGYEGTVDEWLASLKGEKGEDGASIHALRGDEVDILASTNKLVPGDWYLITESTNDGYYKNGDIWYASAVNALNFEGNISGKDYVLTDADKEEIVQSVLAALPSAEGASF